MSKKIFSSSALKIIAILAMLIDHIGVIFYPSMITSEPLYYLLRIIGRIAFPIFAFVLVEGFIHTKNYQRYLGRLLIFALFTEVVFDYAFYNQFFYWPHQNVLFTFCIGLIILKLRERIKDDTGFLIVVMLVAALAQLLGFDYGILGVFMIYCFYTFRTNFKHLAISIILLNLVGAMGSIDAFVQAFASVSLVFIYFYNGQKGYSLKYLFYFFYPLHLLLLKVILLLLS